MPSNSHCFPPTDEFGHAIKFHKINSDGMYGELQRRYEINNSAKHEKKKSF